MPPAVPPASAPPPASPAVAGAVAPAAATPFALASTRVVTATFLRLKLALLRNGVRQSTGRSAAFIGSLVLTVLFGSLGLLSMVALRGYAHVTDVALALVALVALAWAFLPFFVGGVDETLDPGRLAMLPLRPRPLMVAQLTASVVGMGPLFTLLLILGSAFAIVDGTAGWVCLAVAVPLVLVTCTTLTRTLATANARLLTSRRGRDLAVLSGLVVGFGIQLVNLGVSRLSGEDGIGPVSATVDVVRWVPPVSAIDAVRAAEEGETGVVVLGLGGTVALLGLLLWWWQRALTRLMTAPDSSTLQAAPTGGTPRRAGRSRASGRRGGRRGLAALLPRGRTGVVMLRTLRYGWRDPKTKMGWATSLGMGVLLPVVFAAQGNDSIFHACWGAGMLGLLMYNQFGQDYSAFWLVSQTISSRRDAFEELRGRALAVGVIAGPYTTMVVLLSAAVFDAWDQLPEAMGISLALLGSLFGVGAFSSARYPYSIPQDNPMKNVAAGQASVAWVSILCGSLAAAGLTLPVLGLGLWWGGSDSELAWTVLPLGAGYGLLLAYLGLRLGAGVTASRLPEILDAVSRS
ncbi:transporter [Streptomyces sp. 4N509B]|uniref:transporter n=1 Tax=Streptomyces sp. 4N509B TaxID=3457413 RepID=UPI003FD3FED7